MISTQFLVSLLVLASITVPLAIGFFILFRNEVFIEKGKTAGYGMPIIIGFILVFIVMPIMVFLTSK